MNIDTRWFEKGYAKEDVHSCACSPYAPKQRPQPTNSFMTVTPCEEWEQYIRQASLESSAAMKTRRWKPSHRTLSATSMTKISLCPMAATDGICTSGVIPLAAPQTHPNGISYFTLTFNERQTLEKRKKSVNRYWISLCSRFQEHPNPQCSRTVFHMV